ncbi:hypothetical protein MiTe_04644 [Microcystis aeruginosa NIES-2520]|uniref:Uncharacterized protein n=1 Tax=Microcystis aeruginosa NIES-2520 TaxID=2303982 RepID=A0A5A5RXI0_MICAE|nr:MULTISPECIES: hypothetical protein [Microcystis]GCA77787.1 hypothetical protein MiTe_04644 [Microcystis aeruginosa NIES-2520]
MQWTGVIRDGTLIEKDVWRFLSIVFDLERTNQLNLSPDKDLVDLFPLLESYQVTKSRISYRTYALYKFTMVCMNENRSFQTFGD